MGGVALVESWHCMSAEGVQQSFHFSAHLLREVPSQNVGLDLEIMGELANDLSAERLLARKHLGYGRLRDPRVSTQVCLGDSFGFHEMPQQIGVRGWTDGVVFIFIRRHKVAQGVQIHFLTGSQAPFGEKAIQDLLCRDELRFGPDRHQREGEDQLEVGVGDPGFQGFARIRGNRSASSFWMTRRRTRPGVRRSSKAPALVFPSALIILFVSHNFEDENLLTGISNSSNEPILVTANIENRTVSDEARVAERSFYVRP